MVLGWFLHGFSSPRIARSAHQTAAHRRTQGGARLQDVAHGEGAECLGELPAEAVVAGHATSTPFMSTVSPHGNLTRGAVLLASSSGPRPASLQPYANLQPRL